MSNHSKWFSLFIISITVLIIINDSGKKPAVFTLMPCQAGILTKKCTFMSFQE